MYDAADVGICRRQTADNLFDKMTAAFDKAIMQQKAIEGSADKKRARDDDSIEKMTDAFDKTIEANEAISAAMQEARIKQWADVFSKVVPWLPR